MLTASTAHDDAIDTLFGEGGANWFSALPSGPNQYKVQGKDAGAVVTGM